MEIPELIPILFYFLVGGLLGLLFFGGLWLTITKGMLSKNPAIWFFVSMLFRIGLVVMGFYFVTRGQLARLLPCLAGFIAIRMVMTKRLEAAKKATFI